MTTTTFHYITTNTTGTPTRTKLLYGNRPDLAHDPIITRHDDTDTEAHMLSDVGGFIVSLVALQLAQNFGEVSESIVL